MAKITQKCLQITSVVIFCYAYSYFELAFSCTKEQYQTILKQILGKKFDDADHIRFLLSLDERGLSRFVSSVSMATEFLSEGSDARKAGLAIYGLDFLNLGTDSGDIKKAKELLAAAGFSDETAQILIDQAKLKYPPISKSALLEFSEMTPREQVVFLRNQGVQFDVNGKELFISVKGDHPINKLAKNIFEKMNGVRLQGDFFSSGGGYNPYMRMISARPEELLKSPISDTLAHEIAHAHQHLLQLRGVDSIYHGSFSAEYGHRINPDFSLFGYDELLSLDEMPRYANTLIWLRNGARALRGMGRTEEMAQSLRQLKYDLELFGALTKQSKISAEEALLKSLTPDNIYLSPENAKFSDSSNKHYVIANIKIREGVTFKFPIFDELTASILGGFPPNEMNFSTTQDRIAYFTNRSNMESKLREAMEQYLPLIKKKIEAVIKSASEIESSIDSLLNRMQQMTPEESAEFLMRRENNPLTDLRNLVVGQR